MKSVPDSKPKEARTADTLAQQSCEARPRTNGDDEGAFYVSPLRPELSDEEVRRLWHGVTS